MKRQPRGTAFASLGTTGLKQSHGDILEEWHLKLQGQRGVLNYREMKDNDAVIGAFLYAITSFVRGVEWRIVPADENDPKALAAAEFLEQCRDDMSITWDDFIAEVLSMLPFGWSYFEILYKRRIGPRQKDPARRSKFTDGRIGWRKFDIRSQETLWRWELDEDGGIQGMIQNDIFAHRGPVLIPIRKALLFRTTTHKNNPEGRSILRNAFRSWSFLRRIQEIEAIGIERDLAGLPVASVPLEVLSPDATPAQIDILNSFKDMVQKVRRDEFEGVVKPTKLDVEGNPTGYDFELMSTGGRRQLDVDAVIQRYEKRIASTVLHDWILLGQDKVGSFALASSKTQASALATEAILDQIESVLNRIAIERLFEFNPEFPRESWPKFAHGDIEVPDLQAMADFVSKLVASELITPDKGLERHFRQLGSLPEADEKPETDIPAPEKPGRPQNGGRRRRGRNGKNPDQRTDT